jgi:hypothetical protein
VSGSVVENGLGEKKYRRFSTSSMWTGRSAYRARRSGENRVRSSRVWISRDLPNGPETLKASVPGPCRSGCPRVSLPDWLTLSMPFAREFSSR